MCDHDFVVRFFNTAIDTLVGQGATHAANAPDGLTGMAMLGLLGVGKGARLDEIMAPGGWSSVGRLEGANDSVQVSVEAFRNLDGAAGWLIIARVPAAPAVTPPPSDRDLIAHSGKLTAREREVMLALQEGASNKAIALRLGISPRTVEFHRARIMKRFGATSIVDLVRRIVTDAQVRETP